MSATVKTVKVEIDGEFYEFDSDAFREYKNKIFDELSTIETAKSEFKGHIDVVAETTGIKKALLGKFFRKLFKSELDSNSAEAKTLLKLKAALNGQSSEDDAE